VENIINKRKSPLVINQQAFYFFMLQAQKYPRTYIHNMVGLPEGTSKLMILMVM